MMVDITAELGTTALVLLVGLILWSMVLPDDRGEIEREDLKTPRLYPSGTIVRVSCDGKYHRGIVISNETLFAGVFTTYLEMIDDEMGFSFKMAFPSEEICYWGEEDADIAQWRDRRKEFLKWKYELLFLHERGKC